MFRAEIDNAENKECRESLKRAQNLENCEVFNKMYNLRIDNDFKKYYAYKIVSIENTITRNCLKMSVVKCPLNCKIFYDNKIVVNQELWKKNIFELIETIRNFGVV